MGRLSNRSRSLLESRFKGLRPASRFAVPVRGWIKAVRQALGMSSAQLAKRLGIKQPSVIALEQSEAKGTIQLDTLRRVAGALNCTLVYALVPNQPLDSIVRDRARMAIRRRLGPIEHSMSLEDQAVDETDFEAQIDEMVRDINPRLLWDD